MSLFTRTARCRPAARILSARTYASVAEASGVRVAGIEGAAPPGTVNLTVVVKAGSRFETKPGVSHALKNFAFKSTSSGSALKIARETELYGGVLSSTLTREHLFLTAEFLRGDEAHFLQLLAQVLSETQYYPHEYAELVLPSIQNEFASAIGTPSVHALDLAHTLAFRKGLGNSLFAAPHSPVSIGDVKSFARQAFAKSNIAVLGGGISTDALQKAVSSAFGGGSSSDAPLNPGSSTYFGGETRVPIDLHAHPESRPTIVLGFGTAGVPSADLKVLPHLLGGVSSVKWCSGTSPLSQVAESVPGATVSTSTLAYSDASLFTVALSAPTNQSLRSLARSVVSTLKDTSSFKEDDLRKAVAKSKLSDAARSESSQGLLSTVAGDLFSGQIASADASFASYDKVSASSLSKAASNLFKTKPTFVAIGDIDVLPYADEVGL